MKMKLCSTKSVMPGQILAQSIYNDAGAVLLAKGVTLTERMLIRLSEQGVTYIYTEDEFSDEIERTPVISDRLREKATKTIIDTFEDIRNEGGSRHSFVLENRNNDLQYIVEEIMGEIKLNNRSLSLLSDIFITDDHIFQHSLHVAIYAITMAVQLGYPAKEITEIGVAALLHDLGKIFIDPAILNKPGRLSDAEMDTVKQHTTIGFELLRKQPGIPGPVALCALQHHERLDGSGYPIGIKNNEIHPYAKIIGIADVFDAVTSNRVYRDALLPHEGLEIIYAGAMTQFDKELVEAFKKSISVYPEGLTVELSDYRKGIVVRQNEQLCERPILKILSVDGEDVEAYELDLGKVLDVTVTSVIKN